METESTQTCKYSRAFKGDFPAQTENRLESDIEAVSDKLKVTKNTVQECRNVQADVLTTNTTLDAEPCVSIKREVNTGTFVPSKASLEDTDEMTGDSCVNCEELWESINLNDSTELVPEEPAEDREQQPGNTILKYTDMAQVIKQEPNSSGDLLEENRDDPHIATEAFASLCEKQEATWSPEERTTEKACKELEEMNVPNAKVAHEGFISGVTGDLPYSRQKGKVISAPLEEPTDVSCLMREVLITEGLEEFINTEDLLKEPFTFNGKVTQELDQDGVATHETAEGGGNMVTQMGPKRVEKSEPCRILSINVEPETSISVRFEKPELVETNAQQLASCDTTVDQELSCSRDRMPICGPQEPGLCLQQDLVETADEEKDEEDWGGEETASSSVEEYIKIHEPWTEDRLA